MCNIKRRSKDSVFTTLFSHKEYALQLFKVLHPEEEDATEKDIEIITIDNVFTDGIYNDLGLMFRDRLIILAEAQSTWNGNMAVRSLLYLSETYKRYIGKNGISLFTSSTVQLPVPEIYVIYTGDRGNHPDEILLSEHFPKDSASPLQLRVKMVYDGREGDIIYQYINFCRVFDDTRRKYPESIVFAVKETFRICCDRKLLAGFLKEHELELYDIMYDFLYNEEYWRKLMLRDERMKARAEGLAEGAHDKAVETAKSAIAMGLSVEQTVKLTGLTAEEINQLMQN
ncbi:hypothetical protein [Treponema sp.]|uniref:hypothetical protein n=1 Tax=Treponema sp. TaxID=166 RepID=UPI00388F8C9E